MDSPKIWAVKTPIVKLNIGGIKYITTKQTLLGHLGGEHNFFGPLLNGQVPSLMIEDWFFIDRDGIYFQPILEYLRTGDVVIPPGMNINSILREAEFFGIEFPLSESSRDSLTYITDEWLTRKKKEEQYNAISNLADEILVDVLSQFKQCAVDGKKIQTTAFMRSIKEDDLIQFAKAVAAIAKRQHETQDIKSAFQNEITKTLGVWEAQGAEENHPYFLCLDDQRNRRVLIEKCNSNFLGVQIESICVTINWKGTVDTQTIGYYFVHAAKELK